MDKNCGIGNGRTYCARLDNGRSKLSASLMKGALSVTKVKRTLSFVLAVLICASFCVNSGAFSYVDYWPNTHRNTGQHTADIIGVARTQLGYTELSTSTGLPISSSEDGGYTKYGAYFGESTGAWCLYFISWCAYQAGIPSSVVPRLGNCNSAVSWYKSRNAYFTPSSGYVPKTGDIVFYNWNGGSSAQHVGLVTGVSGNSVYTIEGNTNSSLGYQCAGKTRSMSAGYIVGYGVPRYNDAETYVGSFSFASSVSGGYSSKSDSIIYSTSKLSIITTSATEITSSKAVLNGGVSNAGSLRISSKGFYFGEKKNSLKKYSDGKSSREKEISISMDTKKDMKLELKPKSTYYYRAYATIDGNDYLGPMYAVETVDDKPKQVVISEEKISVGVGQTAELMAAQLPFGSKDNGLTWKSEDEKIVKVSQNGVVTGVSFGKTDITVTSNYGNVSAKCKVNVLIPTPQNLTLKNASYNSISVKWDCVENAKGYVLYRAKAGDKEFIKYKKFDADENEFLDRDIIPGERYYYKLMTLAKDEEYNSDLTETAYIGAKLPAVTKIKVKNDDDGSAVITWSKVKKADKYIVYRSESENGLYTAVDTVYGEKFTDTCEQSNGKYFYKIVCANENENCASDYSEVVSATVNGLNNCIVPAQISRTFIGYKINRI